MPAYFLDSSALVKRYVNEPGTPVMLVLFGGPYRLVVSQLARVEVISALARRGRTVVIGEEQWDAVVSALATDFHESLEVVELGGGVMSRAADLARVHALKAGDAIQLACALTARSGASPETVLTVVSADRELNSAAQREGLETLDPTES